MLFPGSSISADAPASYLWVLITGDKPWPPNLQVHPQDAGLCFCPPVAGADVALLLSPCYVVSGFLLSWTGQCPSPRKHAVPASPSLRSLASVGPALLLAPLTANCNLDRVVGLHFGAPSRSLPCSSWLSHPRCRWSCSRGHGDVPARSEGGSCPVSPFLSAPLFLNRSLKHRLLVVWLRRHLPAFEGACSSPGSLGVRPWPRGGSPLWLCWLSRTPQAAHGRI